MSSWWVSPDEMNEEQKTVVTLPVGESQLILGPPGSGKTNLLLLRASYLTLRGLPNVALVVFNRGLKEFITAGSQSYDFGTDRIMTSMRFIRSFIRDRGKNPDDYNYAEFTDTRKALAEAAHECCEVGQISGYYDSILLDEAQDYTPDEVKLFLRLGNSLMAVADSEQRIYLGDDPIPTLRSLMPVVVELRYHYRNGQKICEAADRLLSHSPDHVPLVEFMNYDEAAAPSLIVPVSSLNLEAQIKAAVNLLKRQLQVYRSGLLGVVCTLLPHAEAMMKALHAEGLMDIVAAEISSTGYAPIKDSTRICVCITKGVKGFEFEAMHVIGSEDFTRSAQSLSRNSAYTLLTRAKTVVHLHYSGKLPPFLDSAIAVQKDQDEVAVADLFKKNAN